MTAADRDAFFMRAALDCARQAADNGEVPIGAVIVRDDAIIATGYNRRELDGLATHHAEIVAIEAANAAVGGWRLTECALYVTVEPCIMCAGAIGLSRLSRVVYGAANPKFGAAGSLYQLLEDPRLNHRVALSTGVLADEAAALMQNFFRQRRNMV